MKYILILSVFAIVLPGDGVMADKPTKPAGPTLPTFKMKFGIKYYENDLDFSY